MVSESIWQYIPANGCCNRECSNSITLSGGIAHALSSFLRLTSDCGLVYSGELNLQDKHAQRHFNI